MMTKEQERTALEKIRDILTGLDNNSYVATAFDGCIEDAERNIKEDAMYSMKSRCSALEKQLHDSAEMIKKLNAENADLQAALYAAKERLTEVNHALNMEILNRREIHLNGKNRGQFRSFDVLPGFVRIERADKWIDCIKFEDIKELTIK